MSGLITIGETLALLTSPRIGGLRHQSSLDLSIGGAESNTAIAVARLGGKATWIGRVSDDGLGQKIVATIRGEGVRVLSLPDAGPTSIMMKDRHSALQTRVHYWRSQGPGSRLHPRDLPEHEIRRHAVLHVTGITPALSLSARAAVLGAVEVARAAGVTVSFDVNYRASLWTAREATPVLRDLAARADLIFVGDDELSLLGIEDPTPERAAAALALRGPREVVVKRGARGAVVLADGTLHREDGITVPVIDTVGAGDAFAGGYLAELLLERPVDERLETAVACGAFAVTTTGDWEASPTRGDLRALHEDAAGVSR